MKKRLEIMVMGQIQNVFFRASILQLAEKLKITGWVKNEFDGTVVVLAEGKKKNLKELLAFCKVGSKGAKVKEATEKWSNGTDEWLDFNIISAL